MIEIQCTYIYADRHRYLSLYKLKRWRMHTHGPRYNYTSTAHILVYTHIRMRTQHMNAFMLYSLSIKLTPTYILACRLSLCIVLYRPICWAVNIKVIQQPTHKDTLGFSYLRVPYMLLSFIYLCPYQVYRPNAKCYS